jgi:hypothetical protein
MSEGFAANVEYFKLGFLDKNSVSLGQQFAEILPLLWLKAGAIGKLYAACVWSAFKAGESLGRSSGTGEYG